MLLPAWVANKNMDAGEVLGLGWICILAGFVFFMISSRMRKSSPGQESQTSDWDIEQRRRELQQRERTAREILRRLDCPAGIPDGIWTVVSYATGGRATLRTMARKELEDIATERRCLAERK